MTRLTKITALASVVVAFGGGTALAQSPADEVYNPNGGVLDVVESGAPTPTPTPAPVETATPAPEATTAPETESGTAPATSTEETQAEAAAPAAAPEAPAATPTTQTQQAQAGDLPFTGFEAGFVALAGLALLGGGLAMRRAAREH